MVNLGVYMDSWQVPQTNKTRCKPIKMSLKTKSILIGEWPYQSQSPTETTCDGLELKRQRKQKEEKKKKDKKGMMMINK